MAFMRSDSLFCGTKSVAPAARSSRLRQSKAVVKTDRHALLAGWAWRFVAGLIGGGILALEMMALVIMIHAHYGPVSPLLSQLTMWLVAPVWVTVSSVSVLFRDLKTCLFVLGGSVVLLGILLMVVF